MKKEFRFFDLSLPARLVIAGALYALGAGLELFLRLPLAAGAVFAILGWFPLMLKGVTNRPEDQGLEEWRPVTMAEIDRLDDGLRESKKLRARLFSPRALLIFLVVAPILLILWLAGRATGRADLAFLAFHGAFFVVPALFFGRVSVYEPADIALKMPCFRALSSQAMPEGLVLAPYLRFDKDKKGADVPEDLRFLLEKKRSPEDLVGVQLQAAINKGPNGAVPYLYAVVLTKGRGGPSHAAASRLHPSGYEVEAGGDEDYGTVVIRQKTSGSGYQTDPEDCERLFSLCQKLLQGLS